MSVPTSSRFCKSLRRICISSSLYVWKNSPVKTSGLVLCLYGFFCLFVLITDSLSLLVISLFKLFLLDSVLVSSIFLQGCPFHLSCQIYWHIIVLSIPLVFFFFSCGIGCCISFLISYFVYLGSVSFFGEPGQRFISFIYSFKDPALGFIDFFHFLIATLFSIFIPSFC